MARTERLFRIRVSTRGADSMSGDTEGSGNVDLIFRDADIPPGGLPDSWGGQDVSPLEGRVKTQGWTVAIIDEGDQVTSNISEDFSDDTAFEEADILHRLVDISTSEDGGTTWTVEATGRLGAIQQRQDNPSVYDIEVVDPLSALFDNTVFEKTSKLGTGDDQEATTSLFPAGTINDWARSPGIDDLAWKVDEVTGNRVTLTRAIPTDVPIIERGRFAGRVSNVPGPVRNEIEGDLKPSVKSFDPDDVSSTGTSGDFEHLRFWVKAVGADKDSVSTSTAGAQANYEMWAQKSLFNKNGDVGEEVEKDGTKSRTIKKVSLVWPSNQPAEGDVLTGLIYLPNIAPTDNVPLHFGGSFSDDLGSFAPENGLHPIDWVKKVLDQTAVPYNSSQLDTKKKQRADMTRLWPRVTQPVEVWQNLRENVFKPFGLAPLTNASGEIEIQDTLLPTEDEISDTSNLTTIDESKHAGPNPPDLRIQGKEQVTRVTQRFPPWRESLAEGSDQYEWAEGGREPDAADMMIVGVRGDDVEREKKYERHTDDFGVHEQTFDYRYVIPWFSPQTRDVDTKYSKQVAEAILDRYAWGGIRTQSTVMEAVRDLKSLDRVILNVGSYPGLQSGTRGEKRLLQIVRYEYRQVGASIELLDAGPDKQPLPKPSISATVQGPFSIDGTVGGSGGTGTSLEGGRFVVEVARNSTQPSTDSEKWHPGIENNSQGTYTLAGLSPNTTYWLRARQFSEQRIASAWTTPISKTTDAATAPTSLSVAEDLGCAVRLSWTNGDSSLRTQILVDSTVRTPPEPPAASERFVTGLDPSTSYTFEVRHLGTNGGVTSTASVTHTTSSASTGPRTGGIYRLVGGRP